MQRDHRSGDLQTVLGDSHKKVRRGNGWLSGNTVPFVAEPRKLPGEKPRRKNKNRGRLVPIPFQFGRILISIELSGELVRQRAGSCGRKTAKQTGPPCAVHRRKVREGERSAAIRPSALN